MTNPPEELEDLETILSEIDEEPTGRAVLADITCDSDGKVDRFVDIRDINRTLPLHELRKDEPYHIAAFLVGAYQETLGTLHNLFGDVHVAHIGLDDNGGWTVEEIVHGDTAAQVLSYVQYKPQDRCDWMSAACARAEREGTLTATESREVFDHYQALLMSSTYIEPTAERYPSNVPASSASVSTNPSRTE